MYSTVDYIYNQLKKKIILLELVPGTKITEECLTSQYKISRTPIRSVIARLEKDGLIEVVPKKGTFVSRISKANISSYIYLRSAAEEKALRELATNFTDEYYQILHAILVEQQKICEMDTSVIKSTLFYENDNIFHKKIFELTGNVKVWELIADEATPLNRVRIMSNLRDTHKVEYIYEQHILMLNSLKDNKIEEAVEIFINHIDSGFEDFSTVESKYSDYFK